MNQAQLERSLKPSQAHALDIVRNHGGINRYQADMHLGNGNLSQRVSELGSMGFNFAIEYREYIDLLGNERKGVAHYSYLGWSAPTSMEGAA